MIISNKIIDKFLIIGLYGLSILLILSIIMLIFIYYKSIIEKLLLPRLSVGFFASKILSPIIQSERLNLLIKLRSIMDNRFGHFSQVPLILIMGTKKPNWKLNTNINIIESSDLYAIVNEQMALLHISNIETIDLTIGLLNDIMDGRSHTGILFEIEWNDIINGNQIIISSKINYLAQYIFTITENSCNHGFIFNMTPLFSEFNGDLLSIYDSLCITFLQNTESHYMEKLEEFSEYLNNIFIYDPKTNGNSVKSINLWNKNCDNVLTFLTKLEISNYGLFLTTNNNNSETIFINDVFHVHCNIMSNNYILNKKKSNKTISYYIYSIILIAITVFSLFSIKCLYSNLKKFDKSLSNCEQYLTNYQDQNIWDDILNLNLKPTFINKNIYKTHITNLHSISQFMINKQLENSDINGMFYEEVFDFSPIETKNFYYLDRSVSELSLRLDATNGVPKEKNMNKKFNDYDFSLKSNIIKCFDYFFNTFKNSHLLIKLEYLQKLLNEMISKSVTLQTLIDIKNTATELQMFFGIASNDWWINKNLGNLYNNLIEKINENNLKQTILQNQEFALQKFIDKVLSSEHVLCGKIVNIESQLNGKKLIFSVGMVSLLNTINYIIQEPLVNISIQDTQLNTINDSEITIWDLNELDEIIMQISSRNNINNVLNNIRNSGSTGPLLAQISTLLIDKNLHNFFVHAIKQAHETKPISISLEDKVINFLQSAEKLQIIEKFVNITFGVKLYFLEEIKQNTLTKIMQEVRKSMDNSIFTSYTRLKLWNKDESLIQSLFQCNGDELGILFSKSMITLQQLKNRILVPIVSYLTFDMEQYEYAQYIIDQVTKYENNTYNHIKSFEDFIVSLRDWKTIWRPKINLLTSTKEFFFFHMIAFKALLISKTNDIAYEQVCNMYNDLAKFFNNRLAGKFPFGSTANMAFSKDIILFILNYRNIRESFYNNEQFMSINGIKETLQHLDLISQLFIIEGNNLFINIKMECLIKEIAGSKNTNLILNFNNKFGDIVLYTDTVNTKYNIQESYTLEIEFVNSSVLKISNMNGAKINKNKLRLEFFENFGFLSFVEKFRTEQIGEDVLIKLIIPIVDIHNDSKTNVICFMKVFNWPIFPLKLTLI